MAKLEDLLKGLLKNGLKMSPKKSWLFLEERITMCGEFYFFKDRRVDVKPLRSRLETIQKLKLPTTVKGCRPFTGMINVLNLFCPEL